MSHVTSHVIDHVMSHDCTHPGFERPQERSPEPNLLVDAETYSLVERYLDVWRLR